MNFIGPLCGWIGVLIWPSMNAFVGRGGCAEHKWSGELFLPIVSVSFDKCYLGFIMHFAAETRSIMCMQTIMHAKNRPRPFFYHHYARNNIWLQTERSDRMRSQTKVKEIEMCGNGGHDLRTHSTHGTHGGRNISLMFGFRAGAVGNLCPSIISLLIFAFICGHD